MSLNYDKIKANAKGDGTQWTSYSDLFMVLSFVFLLLYVVSSLRNGAFSFQSQMEQNKNTKELAQLKATESAYNSLVNKRLEDKSDDQEKKLYFELMDKLSLLQEKAKNEKEQLKKDSLENEKKEMALNKYQQIIRNIINTNMLAKGRIERRDEVIKEKKETIEEKEDIIVEQDETIEEKTEVIAKKEETIELKEKLIEQKQQDILEKQAILATKETEINKLNENIENQNETIKRNNKEIAKVNKNLSRKIKSLKKARKKFKISKKQLAKKIAKLKSDTKKKIKVLGKKNQQAQSQLENVNMRLETASMQLTQAQDSIDKANNVIQLQEEEKQELTSELHKKTVQYQGQMEQLKKEHEKKMQSEQDQFLKDLDQQRLSAALKAKKLAEFKARADAKEKELGEKLSVLADQVSASQRKLSATEAKASAATAREMAAREREKVAGERAQEALDTAGKLEAKNVKLAEDLKKSQAKEAAKRKIAQDIQKNLKDAGVDASIDPKSGEVVLSFGKEYFDSGRAVLKNKMMKAIQKFMPIYSAGLFKNPKIAKKIKNVEIIGFSSPTYKGKYIDPKSLNLKDRLAMGYNLTLSFKRAKSIFNYVTNPKKMKFAQQKNLLPYLKVSGRSFLAEGTKGRSLASGISSKEYCKKYDCKKSQRVIIKFTLKD